MLGKGEKFLPGRKNCFPVWALFFHEGQSKTATCQGGFDPPSSNKSVSIATTGFRVKPGMTR